MNEDQHDSQSPSGMDRALMDYLNDILGEAPQGRNSLPQNLPNNIKTLEQARVRSVAQKVQPQSKQASKQPLTLPFKTPEKPKVLPTLNLLNIPPPPPPAKPKAELKSVVQEPVPRKIAEPVPPIEVSSPKKATLNVESPDITEHPSDQLPAESEIDAYAEKLPPAEAWHDNGRPQWAQHRFECLIFNVAGLKLAVPLISLGAIHRIDRKFNALPHQSDWFIGILQTPAAGNIKVLDTALCVMPERYDMTLRDSLAYVITIHGYRWGLACHGVEKSISLDPEQVKWRSQRGKRPWLAGTVVDHMCALLDTDGFREVIEQAERNT